MRHAAHGFTLHGLFGRVVKVLRFEPDPLRIGKAFEKLVVNKYPEGMVEGSARAEVRVSATRGVLRTHRPLDRG
jgi:hypothetical protein